MFKKLSFKYLILTSGFLALSFSTTLSQANVESNGKIGIQRLHCKEQDSLCAKQFVIHIGDSTLETLSKVTSENEKKERLIQIFDKSVDTSWMAKFVAGSNWRDIPEDKKKTYQELYHKYLIETYIPEFNSYSSQSINYKGVTEEFEGEYMVETEITSPNSPSYDVSYKVRKIDNGSFKIFDIVAEGISLISAQRSEFSSIISRKGNDHLKKILKKKVK